MDIAISYGTYYSYLKPKARAYKQYIADAEINKFKDGEVAVKFTESLRGKHVFIFGDTVGNKPELEMTIDAARRSFAGKITVVFPYYGYSRQDKRDSARGSIGCKVMATTLQPLGVNSILTMDIHNQASVGFWEIPFDHISGVHLFAEQIDIIISQKGIENVLLCYPDVGGRLRVQQMAAGLSIENQNIDIVGFDKTRKKANEVDKMQFLQDPAIVPGKTVIKIDDIYDTGGTVGKSDQELYKLGAADVINFVTHPVFSDSAEQRIRKNNIKLVTTNSRRTVAHIKANDPLIEVIDCSDIFLDAIISVGNNKSISKSLG